MDVVEQLEPKRVLDIGMLLKRFGCISRNALNKSVHEDVILDGIDVWSQIQLPVWNSVYDSIFDMNEWSAHTSTEGYDLAVLLGTKEILEQISILELFNGVSVKYLLTDQWPMEWKHYWGDVPFRTIKVDEDVYYMVELGDKKWIQESML